MVLVKWVLAHDTTEKTETPSEQPSTVHSENI